MATEIIQDAQMPTKSFVEQYGTDIGCNNSTKVASALGGAALGGLIGKKIGDNHAFQTGNPLAAIIGALGGSVIAYKIVPSVATDVQRANQYVDQQVQNGKSEGNLGDRFKAVLQNIADLRGQKNVPTIDNSYEA